MKAFFKILSIILSLVEVIILIFAVVSVWQGEGNIFWYGILLGGIFEALALIDRTRRRGKNVDTNTHSGEKTGNDSLL